jgi:histidinol-phosphatase (PHP family)
LNWTNFHTHTRFCDGADEPEKYVEEAVRQGFESLGFSAHAPLPYDNPWSLKSIEIEKYKKEILRLKEKYADKINVFIALEADYIPEVSTPHSVFKNNIGLDYIIGGVHLVKKKDTDKLWFIDGSRVESYDEGVKDIFNGNIEEAVGAYFSQITEMVQTQKPDIIAHFDKIKMHNKDRYFLESDAWYKKLVNQSINVIEWSGCIVEVNTRGLYKKRSDSFYPSRHILELCYLKKIPVTLSSDAHKPEELSLYFNEAVELLKDVGFIKIMVYTKDGWKSKYFG